MLVLSDEEIDALGEIFNLGVGRAAAALSELVRSEITMTVPQVELIPHSDLSNRMNSIGDKICLVWQSISGAVNGRVSLYFSGPEALEVFNSLFDSSIPSDRIAEYETDALIEVGNIILNACVGSVANLLGVAMKISIPSLVLASPDRIVAELDLDPRNRQRHALMLTIRLGIAQKQISGQVAVILDAVALEAIRSAVGRYLADLD